MEQRTQDTTNATIKLRSDATNKLTVCPHCQKWIYAPGDGVVTDLTYCYRCGKKLTFEFEQTA